MELVNALRELEKTPGLKTNRGGYLNRDNQRVIETSMLAETTLITPAGRCDWDAIDVLREHGYDVFPIERDRFGWVLGGIQTSVGILVYG